MRTADPNRKLFEVFELSAANGKNWFKIEGRPKGKRERYYFKTEREAKKGAADRNAQIVAFGSQGALPDSDRVMALECIRMLKEFGKNLYDATHFYRDFLSRQASSISVAELCERVMSEFTRRRDAGEISPLHWKKMRDTVNKFRAQFAHRPIKDLDALEIKSWIAGEPLAIKTRNNVFTYIRNMYSCAQTWGLLDNDPFAKVSKFSEPNGQALRVENLTPEQLSAFLNAAEPEFQILFALNAFTGLRRAEIERLDWSEVKLDRNLIDLPASKSKNHRRKLLEVSENLAAWLKPYVRTEGKVVPSKGLQEAMERAAEKAGIEKWPHNGLRHSFCSYSVTLKGLTWTSLQADHSESMLKKHYREVVDRESAERYWSIVPA
jgi:integrase